MSSFVVEKGVLAAGRGNVLIASGGNLFALDNAETRQSYPPVDVGPEIGTRDLYLWRLGLAGRKLAVGCLGRGLALTNKPVLVVCRLDRRVERAFIVRIVRP
jgi:hypothetical protein